jgi:hypothetical protein
MREIERVRPNSILQPERQHPFNAVFSPDQKLSDNENQLLQEELFSPGKTVYTGQMPELYPDRTEIGKKYINKQITKAREKLLHSKLDNQSSKQTYVIDFDTMAYRTLAELSGLPGYEKAREELNSYTELQLHTLLAERFHTGLNTYKSKIVDGIMHAEGMDEPMADVLKRGRDFRKSHGSTEVSRENAEVGGFSKIQEVFSHPEVPAGTKMLSVSLPGGKGSIYNKNFYDVFTKKLDEDGQVYIEVGRYSSALMKQEALDYIRKIDPHFGEEEAVDAAYFLAHPIRIEATDKRFTSADAIHQFLHKEHRTMPKEEFKEIVKACTPAILGYIKSLCESVDDEDSLKLEFNAILNIADQAAGETRKTLPAGKNNIEKEQEIFRRVPMSRVDMLAIGAMPVRQVDTGCGSSGGYAVNASSSSVVTSIYGNPYSVAAFGSPEGTDGSSEKKLKCTCPFCNRKVEARIKNGTITCPKCEKSTSYKC